MTPVLQTAVHGFIWALSVSLVIAVSTFCTCWLMKVADDRKAIEVEALLARLNIERKIQNDPEEGNPE